MEYAEILQQLVEIREELSNLGCEPVAETLDDTIKDLIHAYDFGYIK
tara:strand:- start:289 stop:429 length:141 start_codon:yes stop_codon:yes gene_type:complete